MPLCRLLHQIKAPSCANDGSSLNFHGAALPAMPTQKWPFDRIGLETIHERVNALPELWFVRF
jgi:hypothetical protein